MFFFCGRGCGQNLVFNGYQDKAEAKNPGTPPSVLQDVWPVWRDGGDAKQYDK